MSKWSTEELTPSQENQQEPPTRNPPQRVNLRLSHPWPPRHRQARGSCMMSAAPPQLWLVNKSRAGMLVACRISREEKSPEEAVKLVESVRRCDAVFCFFSLHQTTYQTMILQQRLSRPSITTSPRSLQPSGHVSAYNRGSSPESRAASSV